MVLPMNKPLLCALRWERECLTSAQSSTTWFVSTLFKLTALCSHRFPPYHTSPACRLPALEQKLLHSLLGIHPLQHAPLFSLSYLMHILWQHGNALHKGQVHWGFPFCCFPIVASVTAAPAMSRIWIKSQLLCTPLITTSQLSSLLLTVSKLKHFYLPDTASFKIRMI